MRYIPGEARVVWRLEDVNAGQGQPLPKFLTRLAESRRMFEQLWGTPGTVAESP